MIIDHISLENEENVHSQERTFQFAEFASTLYKVEILKLKSILRSSTD